MCILSSTLIKTSMKSKSKKVVKREIIRPPSTGNCPEQFFFFSNSAERVGYFSKVTFSSAFTSLPFSLLHLTSFSHPFLSFFSSHLFTFYMTDLSQTPPPSDTSNTTGQKKRSRATAEQLAILEDTFAINVSPNSKLRAQLSTRLNMTERR